MSFGGFVPKPSGQMLWTKLGQNYFLSDIVANAD